MNLNQTEIHTACPRCGKPFSLRAMIGPGKVIDEAYKEAKLSWRSDVAEIARASGLPLWQCRKCNKTFDTEEPHDRICPECRYGNPQSSA